MANKRPVRVLFTIECDRLDTDVLKVIPALVHNAGLQVTGLYVEDEDLLSAAELPGLSEVSMATGEVRELSRDRIERQLVGEAQRARQQFESFASRLDFNHSFQVVRGRAVDTMTRTAANSDMVVVSRSERGSGLRSRLASHFAPLIQMQQNVLFVNEPWSSGVCVIVLCEPGNSAHDSALAAARRIADIEAIELVAATVADGDRASFDPERSGAAEIADRLVVLRSWSEEDIGKLCGSEDARLLVVPPTGQLDWQKLALSIVDRVPCSLLRLG